MLHKPCTQEASQMTTLAPSEVEQSASGRIGEKHCKTALTDSAMRYDYALNPYVGCLHGCVYGYCSFMRRFSGHMKDPWGSFVDAKVNLIEVLAKELPRKSGGSVWVSSVCDPYQQPESKYKLTRQALKLLSQYPKFTISILTKSAMVLRDLDVIEPIRERVEVGFTITTFDVKAQRIFEPGASPVEVRVGAAKRLSAAGIRTWVFIAPMLPQVTESRLESGLRQVEQAGVRHLATDRFNPRGSVITPTLAAYRKWNPNCDLKEIHQLLWHGDKYYEKLGKRISETWLTMNPDATYEKDPDYETLQSSRKRSKP